MANLTEDKDQQQEMTNFSTRSPYHVSFRDDQQQSQQQRTSINVDDPSAVLGQGLI